jgi:predicted membrane channel-forming protein YqfA (hemolysin III family)
MALVVFVMFPPIAFIAYISILTLAYLFGVIFYRMHFHPLSQFPGPRLAAVSSLWEFWHDIMQGGTFLHTISKTHKKYGKDRSLLPGEI